MDDIKDWLEALLMTEIYDTMGTIKNEKLFMYGSDDSKEETMHYSNICELRQYLKIILNLKKNMNNIIKKEGNV